MEWTVREIIANTKNLSEKIRLGKRYSHCDSCGKKLLEADKKRRGGAGFCWLCWDSIRYPGSK